MSNAELEAKIKELEAKLKTSTPEATPGKIEVELTIKANGKTVKFTLPEITDSTKGKYLIAKLPSTNKTPVTTGLYLSKENLAQAFKAIK
jgi:hypothetical protein